MQSHQPSLTALALAVQIAADGSFASASRRLGLSTSATSKAIARLESGLGIKLFRRTTRRVSLTSEGEKFVQGLQPILLELDELTNDLIASSDKPSGRLRISAPETFGRVILVPLIPVFRSRFPAVEVEVELSDRYADLVSDRVDVAIRSGVLADSAGLVAKRLFVDPVITCASPEYLKRVGAPNEPDELREKDCIGFRNAATGRNMPWRFRDSPAIRVRSTISVSDMESAAALAATGAGITQVPAYLVGRELEDRQVEEVLRDYRAVDIAYSVLYLDRRFVAPRIRVFVDFLAHALSAPYYGSD